MTGENTIVLELHDASKNEVKLQVCLSPATSGNYAVKLLYVFLNVQARASSDQECWMASLQAAVDNKASSLCLSHCVSLIILVVLKHVAFSFFTYILFTLRSLWNYSCASSSRTGRCLS